MRIKLSGVVAALALIGVGASSLLAHHAFSSEFDGNRPIKISGVVTKMEWVNPHAWIHIDVKKPDGTVESWAVEGGTPNTLLRRGLRKSDLPAGTEVTVDGYRAKDGGPRASGRNIALPNGRAIFLSNSGEGQPGDPGAQQPPR